MANVAQTVDRSVGKVWATEKRLQFVPVSEPPGATKTLAEIVPWVVGGGGLAFETVTELDAVAVRPSVAVAFSASVWPPLASVVVSRVPPSPLYW